MNYWGGITTSRGPKRKATTEQGPVPLQGAISRAAGLIRTTPYATIRRRSYPQNSPEYKRLTAKPADPALFGLHGGGVRHAGSGPKNAHQSKGAAGVTAQRSTNGPVQRSTAHVLSCVTGAWCSGTTTGLIAISRTTDNFGDYFLRTRPKTSSSIRPYPPSVQEIVKRPK